MPLRLCLRSAVPAVQRPVERKVIPAQQPAVVFRKLKDDFRHKRSRSNADEFQAIVQSLAKTVHLRPKETGHFAQHFGSLDEPPAFAY
jgi:hypothetical protein